ncbi:uncharacterized protein LOC128641006 isoform X2 [Bombina bombina]|uniref:uncharacterized protein LOC128641006 isoform X2 n=1 Tax=Bombina bombina TaxID=8345 RepID=UPI00235AC4C6|nr:uncharacterized protein LOC128641006 isoform X2 [Bombina bombina]
MQKAANVAGQGPSGAVNWGSVRGRRGRGPLGRKQLPSFTNEENCVLVSKISQYYRSIIGAGARKTSHTRKNVLWGRILDAVNTVGGHSRKVDVVKQRYFDIKRIVKRKLSRAIDQTRGTGRNLFEVAELTSYEEELLQLLGMDNILGVGGSLEIGGSVDTDAPSSLWSHVIIPCNVPPAEPEHRGSPATVPAQPQVKREEEGYLEPVNRDRSFPSLISEPEHGVPPATVPAQPQIKKEDLVRYLEPVTLDRNFPSLISASEHQTVEETTMVTVGDPEHPTSEAPADLHFPSSTSSDFHSVVSNINYDPTNRMTFLEDNILSLMASQHEQQMRVLENLCSNVQTLCSHVQNISTTLERTYGDLHSFLESCRSSHR